MENLTIDTGIGQVVLTYLEVARKWDLFSGSQEAMQKLENMCIEIGWEWDRKLKNYFTNFVAENLDKFVIDENSDKSTDEIWGDKSHKPQTKIMEKYDMNPIVDLMDKSIKKLNSSKIIDYKKIDNIEVSDILEWDCPDYVDAFIESADLDGEPMTEEQLNEINKDSGFVYECVINHLN